MPIAGKLRCHLSDRAIYRPASGIEPAYKSGNVVFVVGMGAAGLADLMDVRLLMLGASLILLAAGLLALVLPGLRESLAQWRHSLHLLISAEPLAERTGRLLSVDDLEQVSAHLPAWPRSPPPTAISCSAGRAFTTSRPARASSSATSSTTPLTSC